jgi:phosphoglycerate dehydrogenase-like enzyme
LTGDTAAAKLLNTELNPEALALRLGTERVDLATLLADGDVCMPLLPLTPATRGLIDEQTIARMRRGALKGNNPVDDAR